MIFENPQNCLNGPQNVIHFYIVGKLACEVPEHDFDDDDINIMMKCLSVCVSVTKNDHFPFPS